MYRETLSNNRRRCRGRARAHTKLFCSIAYRTRFNNRGGLPLSRALARESCYVQHCSFFYLSLDSYLFGLRNITAAVSGLKFMDITYTQRERARARKIAL